MNVVIIGCGVVGAAIAYELSQLKNLKITVLDKQLPAQASTGAALGVLMGVISRKTKGKAWQLRQTSMQRYETLIPELEEITNRKIPFNRQGILMLLPESLETSNTEAQENDELKSWEKLVNIRHSQGYELEIWDMMKLKKFCPQIEDKQLIGAIYSPQDRQLDPTALTLALVEAASQNGVTFKFGVKVLGMSSFPYPLSLNGRAKDTTANFCHQLETTEGTIASDWFILAAGLGSSPLSAQLNQLVTIRPVLGQAWHLRLEHPLGDPQFQPVITGNDVHIVPIGGGDYWVGATVEFAKEGGEKILADKELLKSLKQQAIAFCPELAKATTIRTWHGLRPRPEGRTAPIIGKLPGFSNILLATGHYRNGVLLAPATAYAIREMIVS
ncbi:FAD-dependent oxidoreductase [Chlorogloeopsis sp. ULAP01]|uniref:NAD(P)/FAD-dependent oxidoreductase n=1 Tax=Chlorogloeopsis sp. ULAP01 TaxID=3056483 RepID=UPI0025AAC768|nr:FAD-dependent oxidoreductase [Chlorogloeopsis sp. ULAP01]MDM9379102.1 FAD-dependent oxidoreductase [Chlorogloeopsis sp. ULAP01]